jgi:zinc protease
MLKKWIVLAFVLLISQSGAESVAESYPAIGVETILLDNGLRVVLKHTENDPGEVVVRLTATGGYSELPYVKQAAGAISSQAAFRSGLGEYSLDQFYAMLYDYSLEFEIKIHPFCRTLEGSSYNGELGQLLNIVNLYFTKSRFSRKAFEALKENLLSSLSERQPDQMRLFEEEYMDFNTHYFHAFHSFTAKEIEQVEFEDCQQFFNRCFSNPADFVCVIVGDFDVKEVKKFIEIHLASIPKFISAGSPVIPLLPSSVKGVKTKVIKNAVRDQAITRMTFPIHLDMRADSMENMEAITWLIKERLLKQISQKITENPEVTVSMELPFYPSLDHSWISIQYICDSKLVSSIGQMILVELRNMQLKEFHPDELIMLKKKTETSNYLLGLQNDYWLMVLTNYSLWNWRLDDINKKFSPSLKSKENVNKSFSKCISLDNYSILSQQP